SRADRRIQMGGDVTQGLGAGMRPEVGEESAEDSMAEILEQLEGAHMLFIAAGMGGGTGTGAAPVIARAARERGILTVAIVTKPFHFEGTNRMNLAEGGIARLQPVVDTLITIPNQNLFRIATETTTMTDAFGLADEVLHSGVRSITDLMVVPGVINLDFADVGTVMGEMGKAMMGTGEATGERRAIEAAEAAISNPLLDDVSLRGAKGVLINITGGKDLTLFEVDEAANLIRGQVDSDANIIVGSALDPDLDGIVRVSVVATGVEADGEALAQNEGYQSYNAPISTGYDEQEEAALAPAPRPEPAPTPAPAYARSAVAAAPAYMARINEAERAQSAPAPAPAPAPIAAAPAPVQPVPEAIPAPAMQSVFRNTFSLWGRKKTAPVPARHAAPTALKNTGDLFGSDRDDELEIPSFLRRQNR
ncbi:MAG: cell division protein FtsZ, partial [Robiginitomaculum sp.]